MSEPHANLDKLKIFADGADLAPMLELAGNPRIAGFTTNPTLMRKAGITDYRAFAHEVLAAIPRQADLLRGVRRRASPRWSARPARSRPGATNVYVKIPVTNTKREPAVAADPAARRGGREAERHRGAAPSSRCAIRPQALGGRRAVGGLGVRGAHCRHRARSGAADGVKRSPSAAPPTARSSCCGPARASCSTSSRPAEIGCDIITVTHDLLAKLRRWGRTSAQFSLETVQMFHRDAEACGFKL